MEEKIQFTFEDQRADEDVIFVLKQHPWIMSKSGFMGLALVVLLVVAYLIFGFSKVTSILLVIEIIIIIGYSLYVWFLYNNNLAILTNQRLIIIEQKNLFTRQISESELDKIQNLTVEVKGMMKTLLNFGNIKITTAGVALELSIRNIENPYKVQQQIAKYCKQISNNYQASSTKKLI